jgi:hypothetical protein
MKYLHILEPRTYKVRIYRQSYAAIRERILRISSSDRASIYDSGTVITDIVSPTALKISIVVRFSY